MQNQEIKLECFNETNLEKTFFWFKNKKLRDYFLLEKELTKNSHYKWFNNYKNDNSQKIFSIIYHEVHVGNVGLKFIDIKNKSAEIWIYIGDYKYHNKGIGLAVLNKVIDFCILSKIEKLYCNVANFNNSSISMFKKAGFKTTSTSKKHFKSSNNIIDILQMTLII